MIIKTLKIKNFRTCLNTKVVFNGELTALVGPNASGKTNILSSIKLLQKMSVHNDRNYRNKVESQINTSVLLLELLLDDKPISAKFTVFFTNDEENNDEILNFDTVWDFSSLGLSKKIKLPREIFKFQDIFYDAHSKKFDSGKAELFDIDRKELNDIKKAYPYIVEIFKKLSQTSYYSASQFSDPTQCPNVIEIEENRFKNRYRFNRSHYGFICDLYQSYVQDTPDYKLFLNTVGRQGINLIDSIDFEQVSLPSSTYKVMNGTTIKTSEKENLISVPIFTIDDNKISPAQLSEGTFRTIALVYYLLTDKNSLLIIEEPEVCVHHGLLNSIITIIKDVSKEKQLIISTHSDFVVDHLKPENICLVEKSEKGTQAIALNESLSAKSLEHLKKYLQEYGNLGEFWRETGFKDE